MTDESIPSQAGAGGQLRSPAELSPGDWKATLRRTFKEFKADRATLISAGMAFYWFLAVFPGLLAAVGIFGLVDAGPEFTESITKAIRTALPGDAAEVLTRAVDQAPGGGASVIAAVLGLMLALWSASAGMVALQSGMDVAYDVPAERERKFVPKRLFAFLLMVLTLVLGGVATLLVVFGQPLGEALRDNLPFGGAFVVLWTVMRWVLGLGALSVLFASFYYLGPNRESPRWSWLSPGGVVATLIWLASSLAFSFYVSSFGSYAKTYGSFAGVVVLLLWLFLTALAVVLGAELNAELERQSAIRAGQADGTSQREQGARGAPRAASTPQPADREPDTSTPEDTSAPEPDTSAPQPEAREPGTSEWAKRMEELRRGR